MDARKLKIHKSHPYELMDGRKQEIQKSPAYEPEMHKIGVYEQEIRKSHAYELEIHKIEVYELKIHESHAYELMDVGKLNIHKFMGTSWKFTKIRAIR